MKIVKFAITKQVLALNANPTITYKKKAVCLIVMKILITIIGMINQSAIQTGINQHLYKFRILGNNWNVFRQPYVVLEFVCSWCVAVIASREER